MPQQSERIDPETANLQENPSGTGHVRLSSSLIKPQTVNSNQNGIKAVLDTERDGVKLNTSQDLQVVKSGSMNTLTDGNIKKKMTLSRKSMNNMKSEDYKSYLMGTENKFKKISFKNSIFLL